MKQHVEPDFDLISQPELEIHYSNFESFSNIAKQSLEQLEECVNLLEDSRKRRILHEMQTAKECIEYKSMLFDYVAKSFERITNELNQIRHEIELADKECVIYESWVDGISQYSGKPEELIERLQSFLNNEIEFETKNSTPTAPECEVETGSKSPRIINPKDWRDAWWSGVSLGVDPTGEQPPFIGIHFKSEMLGRQIFESILDQLGREDQANKICIAILQGDVPNYGDGYSVTLTNNTSDQTRTFQYLEDFVCPGEAATLTITPVICSDSLDRFKKAYEQFGEYLMVPMFGNDCKPVPDLDLAVLKKDLVLRDTNDLSSWDA